jgi:hypothetical protein
MSCLSRRVALASSLLPLAIGVACGSPPPPEVVPTAEAPPPSAPVSEPTPAGGPKPADGDRPRAQVATDASAEDAKLVVVETPPFAQLSKKRVKAASSSGKELLKLTKASERRNQITDDEAWFTSNQLKLPSLGDALPGGSGPVPASVPPALRGEPLQIAIRQEDGVILAAYGPRADGGTYVLALSAQGQPMFTLDLRAFLHAAPNEAGLVTQGVRWAQLADGVLYVSTFHRTYARTSGGKNAFITAVDPATGSIYWQSEPLVSNAANFLLWDGFVVSGYGFTEEPDHLVVIDQAKGRTLAKTFVKSGPSYLVRKGSQLFVRTYDTDYVFDVE